MTKSYIEVPDMAFCEIPKDLCKGKTTLTTSMCMALAGSILLPTNLCIPNILGQLCELLNR